MNINSKVKQFIATHKGSKIHTDRDGYKKLTFHKKNFSTGEKKIYHALMHDDYIRNNFLIVCEYKYNPQMTEYDVNNAIVEIFKDDDIINKINKVKINSMNSIIKSLTSNRRYRFDFALINMDDLKTVEWVIEFDGTQHYDCKKSFEETIKSLTRDYDKSITHEDELKRIKSIKEIDIQNMINEIKEKHYGNFDFSNYDATINYIKDEINNTLQLLDKNGEENRLWVLKWGGFATACIVGIKYLLKSKK